MVRVGVRVEDELYGLVGRSHSDQRVRAASDHVEIPQWCECWEIQDERK